MLKNYFLVALRNFKKNRLVTVMNVAGLSIGIAAAVIVYLVIAFNLSFDQFEPGASRIYRVVTKKTETSNFGVPAPFHSSLANIAGIETSTAIFDYFDGNAQVAIPKQAASPAQTWKNQSNIVFTDDNYFQLFPHKWLAGDSKHALTGAGKVVIAKTRAGLYFPGLTPAEMIGRTMIFSDSVFTTVSGVVEDLDANSDFEYPVFLSQETIPASHLTAQYHWDSWASTSSWSQLLVKLIPGVKPETITGQLHTLFAAHVTDKEDLKTMHLLQPLSDVHTNAEFNGSVNKAALGSLALLAFFLLLLGCINFVNLSTAQGTQRAKEIGIRKTFGGNRRQLILQFLIETLVLTAVTSFLAFTLIILLLPNFLPAGLTVTHVLHIPSLVLFLTGLTALVSLLAGLYPAFVLSRYQPMRVLRNNISSNDGVSHRGRLRRVLTVSQFAIAQVFLIAVFAVNKQMHFAIKKDMGFRKDAIVNFSIPGGYADGVRRKSLLRDRLSTITGVERVSIGSQTPAFSGQSSTKAIFLRGHDEIKLGVDLRSGDTNWLTVYHIPLLAGRTVQPSDTMQELVVNETLVRQLQFPTAADALGQVLNTSGRKLPIVGVMADFNQASVRSSIQPVIFYSAFLSDNLVQVSLTRNRETWPKTLAAMKTMFNEVYPGEEVEFGFFDETIGRLYKGDTALLVLLEFAAGIAMLISCIGLLGLVIFTLSSRTREISIRKVLGAPLFELMRLLASGLVKLLLLAFAIAVPLAWLLCHAYLNSYAYHTALSWWVFAISGASLVLIALASVSVQIIRAAMTNPLNGLRSE